MKRFITATIVFFSLFAISVLAAYFFMERSVSDLPDQHVENASVRIMPLGDSITEGSGNNSNYRKQLYYYLANSNHSVDFVGSMNYGNDSDWDRDHEGHGGWSADGNLRPEAGNIVDNISTWLNNSNPDIILLHIGTNDVGQNDPLAYKHVEKVLDKIHSYNKKTIIFLALIIDKCYDFPEYESLKKEESFGYSLNYTREFNENLKEMAVKRAEYNKTLFLVDMQNILNCSEDYSDSLHPNDKGYSKIADAWFEALIRNYNFSSKTPNR